MKPVLYIALRFTAARKRALILSLSGVVLGVGFFISTQAQTAGFEQFFTDTVLGTSGAIVVTDRFQERYAPVVKADADSMVAVSGQQPRKYYTGIDNPNMVMRAMRDYSGVLAVAPLLEGSVTIRTDFKDEILKLEGIDLDSQLRATSLGHQLIDGSIDGFRQKPFGLLLGSLIADKLQVHIGDIVYLAGTGGPLGTPGAGAAPSATPTGGAPAIPTSAPGSDLHPFTVEGIFQTGINAIDETRGYVHRQSAQMVMQKPYLASMLIVRLRDPERAPALAMQFEKHLHHRARSWQERERGNLEMLHAIRLSAAITVSLIILLAGFGIFNILTMTVLNKVREIAILRSMGYRRADIQAIFVYQGLIIATIGSVVGCALGAALTFAISQVPVRIRGPVHADTFLVTWSWHHYAAAALIAFASVLIASYFPARRAASLPPVDTLRGSGQ